MNFDNQFIASRHFKAQPLNYGSNCETFVADDLSIDPCVLNYCGTLNTDKLR